MATEAEPPSQPNIAAMLTNQTSARKPAREAIAVGAEVRVVDGEMPQVMRGTRLYKTCVTQSLRSTLVR
ncbi:hypothetical protein ACF08O_31635 [Streptomyces paradoxus]|uniref:hypothetical protein n=1 Tax=Streptomyces paradoxus TaxID=66375 RepID=UPI0036FB2463